MAVVYELLNVLEHLIGFWSEFGGTVVNWPPMAPDVTQSYGTEFGGKRRTAFGQFLKISACSLTKVLPVLRPTIDAFFENVDESYEWIGLELLLIRIEQS